MFVDDAIIYIYNIYNLETNWGGKRGIGDETACPDPIRSNDMFVLTALFSLSFSRQSMLALLLDPIQLMFRH